MAKHTSGPWSIDQTPGEFLIVAGKGSPRRGTWVAEVHMMGGPGSSFWPEPLANANLIASAPELLEALKVAKDYLVMAVESGVLDACSIPGSRALKYIKAVIKRAKEG